MGACVCGVYVCGCMCVGVDVCVDALLMLSSLQGAK